MHAIVQAFNHICVHSRKAFLQKNRITFPFFSVVGYIHVLICMSSLLVMKQDAHTTYNIWRSGLLSQRFAEDVSGGHSVTLPFLVRGEFILLSQVEHADAGLGFIGRGSDKKRHAAHRHDHAHRTLYR